MLASSLLKAIAIISVLASPVLAHGGAGGPPGGSYGGPPSPPQGGHGGPAPPKPSGTACTFTCPGSDHQGKPKHQESCGQNPDNGHLICSYPNQSWRGSFNRDNTCHYDPHSGKLIQDGNGGNCQASCGQTCQYGARYRAEDNFTALKAKKEQRAANPEPASIPAHMRARRSLRKNRID